MTGTTVAEPGKSAQALRALIDTAFSSSTVQMLVHVLTWD